MSLKNVLIGIDQLFNTFLGGTPDETLSARACRLAYFTEPPDSFGLRCYKIINKIFFWQEDHCKTAFDAEIMRKQLHSVYKDELVMQYSKLLKTVMEQEHNV